MNLYTHIRTQTTTVPSEDLEAVQASKNSSVIILQGELKGNTGTVHVPKKLAIYRANLLVSPGVAV